MSEELVRGQVAEGMVRADGVVGLLPGAQVSVQGGDFEPVGDDLIELLGMGALGAFDMTIEFGRAWRKDEQLQAALATGLFEGGERAAAGEGIP